MLLKFILNFGDRPSKIFSGIKDCRVTMVVTEKGEDVKILSQAIS